MTTAAADPAAADPAANAQTRTVRLFGPQARLAGSDAVSVELPAGATAGVLKARLAEACPALAPSLPTSRIAVNHAYAADGDPLPADAELALIGLVSGG